MRVSSVMSTPVVTVAPGTTLREVAALLAERHISGVPVVEDGRVLGIVSQSDIVERVRGCEAPSGSRLRRLLARGRLRRAAYATRAGEAMSSPTVEIEPWMSAYHAAWLMCEHDVDRLPVVERGRLVGIVTRSDIVRHFARSDADLEREIRERILVELSTPGVEVSVDHGRAELAGEVECEADRDDLVHAVSLLPGIVDVRSKVSARTERPSAGVGAA